MKAIIEKAGIPVFQGRQLDTDALSAAANLGSLDEAMAALRAHFDRANWDIGRGGSHIWISAKNARGEWVRLALIAESDQAADEYRAKQVREYRAAIKAAEAQLIEAQRAVANAKREAALALSPVKPGERVPAKTTAGGIACDMEVTGIEASAGGADGTVHLYITGRKLRKDGTPSMIEASAHYLAR